MKVVTIEFTMFNFEGEQTFLDVTVRGAIQKLRHQCSTIIIHKTTEMDVTVNSTESFDVDDKFDIKPKHELNKVNS